MRLDLTGRRVLVTGASSGLGAHFARTVAAAGAAVAIAARRRDRLEALAEAIRAEGGQAHPIEMDVADAASARAGVAAAAASLDGLDGLVNNAGVARGGAALDLSEDAWRGTIDVNLDGVFWVAQAAARAMIESRAPGAVVNVASILGVRVSKGVAAYCASKAAVDHLTRALALEWAKHDIRVNALAPGYVPTDINRDYLEGPGGEEMRQRVPLRRFGRVQDLDGPLLLLLSNDAGAYLTGATIPVDGGHLVSPL